MKGVPILLFAGEDETEEDDAFVRWVHRARRLSNMYALRAVADVRLERKLRFDYAKLKARAIAFIISHALRAFGYTNQHFGSLSHEFTTELSRGPIHSHHYW